MLALFSFAQSIANENEKKDHLGGPFQSFESIVDRKPENQESDEAYASTSA